MNPRHLILIVMVCIYPLVVIPFPYDYFYAPRYIILTLLSLAAFFLLVKDRFVPRHPVYIPLGFFVLFSVISAILAPNQQTAWVGFLRYSGLSTYLFCIILFILASRSLHSDKLIRYMVGGAVIVSALAILQHFGINLVPHEDFRAGFSAFGTMANPNFLGTYTVFILPAAIVLYINEKKSIWLYSSAIIYGALVVCMTRGAWLTFAVIMVIIFVKAFRKAENFKCLVLLVSVFILVTSVLLLAPNNNLATRFHSLSEEIAVSAQLGDSGGSYRIFIWKEAVKLLPQYWAFGMGPDHFVYADIRTSSNVTADKVHNVYLEMAVTLGVFSTFSYLVFLTFFLLPSRAKHNFLYFVMILSYAGQAFFNIDVVMVMPLFWIVLGLCIKANSVVSHEF